MRTKGYKCYNVNCGSCICKTLCGEPADTALGCKDRLVSVQTNADRIRAMSNEELSVFLWNFRLEDVAKGKVEDFGPHLFRKLLKEWLQQPAEEG